jgi:hypothetical protein
MRIRGYLPRGIALTWVLGIPLEECEAAPSRDKLRDIINRFIAFTLGSVPVRYEVRELSRSFLISFTAEVAEPAAMCRKNSDYEYKDCVYTCVSNNIPLAECEEACRTEIIEECDRFGRTATTTNMNSIAHDLASLFEACNVRYYAHMGASTNLHILSFVAFFE